MLTQASLTEASVSGAEPTAISSVSGAAVPTLALLAANVILEVPLDQFGQPLTYEDQLEILYGLPSASAAVGHFHILKEQLEEAVVAAFAYMDTDDSAIDGLSSSDDSSTEESSAAVENYVTREESAVIDIFVTDDDLCSEESGPSDGGTTASLPATVWRVDMSKFCV